MVIYLQIFSIFAYKPIFVDYSCYQLKKEMDADILLILKFNEVCHNHKTMWDKLENIQD